MCEQVSPVHPLDISALATAAMLKDDAKVMAVRADLEKMDQATVDGKCEERRRRYEEEKKYWLARKHGNDAAQDLAWNSFK